MLVSRGCMQKMTIMGWVALVAGTLAMVTALSTDYWVHRVWDGEHTGIFPCCPTFKCGSLHDSTHIDAFIFMLIPGLILVFLGGVMSVIHSCYTWRREDRTFFPLSYITSGSIGFGGLILLSGAITFTATLPNDMEIVLREECHARDYAVETGFSYELYVTAVVAYILAAALVLVGGPKRHSKNPHSNFRSNHRVVVGANTNDVPLQTVSGQVTSQTTSSTSSSPEEQTTSLSEGTQPEVVTSSSEDHQARRSHALRPWQRPQSRSLHHSRTRQCQCAHYGQHSHDNDGIALPPYAQPPSYQEVIADQPPPYSESEPQGPYADGSSRDT